MLCQGIDQGAGIIPVSRINDHSFRFINNHQGVIFMEEVSRGHPMMPFPEGFEASQAET